MILSKKISGYIRLLRWEIEKKRQSLKGRQLHNAFLRWLDECRNTEAELLIGANFDASGGVRNHIHAIHRYTSLGADLVPSEKYRKWVNIEAFTERIADFLSVAPAHAVRAVHSHVSPWFVDWCRFYRSPRVRWIHTHHLLYYPETEVGGLPKWQHDLNTAGLQALRDCDMPLVVSRSQQRELHRMGIEAHYLPNGVDVPLCDAGRSAGFRKRFQIAGDFVLWMGRNERVKNPRDFLLAATALPKLQFVMAGDGCSADKLVESTGCQVPPNVLLIGPLKREVAQNALAACSLLCVTSLREGLPTLILEAMAHQKRIVTSDAEGCLDATDGEAFASVYRQGDTSQLVELIQRKLATAPNCEHARTRVLQEFDWRVIAQRLDRIYRGELACSH
jgi:glycosyltransferase involved in cell wall biosynthesis